MKICETCNDDGTLCIYCEKKDPHPAKGGEMTTEPTVPPEPEERIIYDGRMVPGVESPSLVPRHKPDKPSETAQWFEGIRKQTMARTQPAQPETGFGEPWRKRAGGTVNCDGRFIDIKAFPLRERAIAAVNAVASIPTNALESGVVGEMRDVMAKALTEIEKAETYIGNDPRYNDKAGEILEIQAGELQAVLDKLQPSEQGGGQ